MLVVEGARLLFASRPRALSFEGPQKLSKLIALLDVIVIGRDRNMITGPIHTFCVIAVFLLTAGSIFAFLS